MPDTYIVDEKTYLPANYGQYYCHVAQPYDEKTEHDDFQTESDHELEASLADARLYDEPDSEEITPHDDPHFFPRTFSTGDVDIEEIDDVVPNEHSNMHYSKRPSTGDVNPRRSEGSGPNGYLPMHYTRSFSTGDVSIGSSRTNKKDDLQRQTSMRTPDAIAREEMEEARKNDGVVFWTADSDDEEEDLFEIVRKRELEMRRRFVTIAPASTPTNKTTKRMSRENIRSSPSVERSLSVQKAVPKKPLESITMVVVGRTGEGKSSLLNDIVGEAKFLTAGTATSVTDKISIYSSLWTPLKPFLKERQSTGCEVVVVDTPGFLDAERRDAVFMKQTRRRILHLARGMDPQTKGKGVNAICVVFKVHASTDIVTTTLRMFSELMYPHTDFWAHVILVFTHADFNDVSYRENKVFLVNELNPALTNEFGLREPLPMIFISTKLPHTCAYARGLGHCDCPRANRYHADCRRRFFQQVWSRRGEGWKVYGPDDDDDPQGEPQYQPEPGTKRENSIGGGGTVPGTKFISAGGLNIRRDDSIEINDRKPSRFVEENNTGIQLTSQTQFDDFSSYPRPISLPVNNPPPPRYTSTSDIMHNNFDDNPMFLPDLSRRTSDPAYTSSPYQPPFPSHTQNHYMHPVQEGVITTSPQTENPPTHNKTQSRKNKGGKLVMHTSRSVPGRQHSVDNEVVDRPPETTKKTGFNFFRRK